MLSPPLRVTMIRNSTLLLEWGELAFLTDPWFARTMRGLPCYRAPGLEPEELPPLTAILASHLHPDHWDEEAIDRLVALPERCVLPPDGLAHIRKRTGAEAWEELAAWQSTTVGPATIWAVPGPHTYPPPAEVNYVIEMPGWGRAFFGGDSVFDADTLHQIAQRFAPIRVALVPVGATTILGTRTTMGPGEAYEATLALGADRVVPIHEGGIWMSVPPLSLHLGRAWHLERRFRRRGQPERVVVLEEGERATFRGG